ncbi:hypothetical protein GCK72_006493 [Caenorhabditis remanei]|uniref:Uncharacterized protein n=1 Tax=Caenorhabditis remanei TaxID=31234 RepID=A0A6A5HIL7_CAERE|nr:hypothetical protein GCK72_006493 [Caenorhabditis remanei]KAF1766536.1 hypothetical protein GCK72_006493 [Caenorhabditis remanei]
MVKFVRESLCEVCVACVELLIGSNSDSANLFTKEQAASALQSSWAEVIPCSMPVVERCHNAGNHAVWIAEGVDDEWNSSVDELVDILGSLDL